MAHLIDKDALVAEIERRVTAYQKNFDKADNKIARLSIDGRIAGLKSLLSFLNTLEVKEVDFEKELDRIWFDNKLGNYFDNDALDFAHVRTLCKHFFELGLKVQKGE